MMIRRIDNWVDTGVRKLTMVPDKIWFRVACAVVATAVVMLGVSIDGIRTA